MAAVMGHTNPDLLILGEVVLEGGADCREIGRSRYPGVDASGQM
jgi:hypothetical protein